MSTPRSPRSCPFIGFAGVIAVVRPGPSGFSPSALLVIAAAGALVVREFATRRVESNIPPLPIASLTAIAITKIKELMDAAKVDVLAFSAFPPDHWCKI